MIWEDEAYIPGIGRECVDIVGTPKGDGPMIYIEKELEGLAAFNIVKIWHRRSGTHEIKPPIRIKAYTRSLTESGNNNICKNYRKLLQVARFEILAKIKPIINIISRCDWLFYWFAVNPGVLNIESGLRLWFTPK